MMNQNQANFRERQRGVALIISLLFLFIVTLISVVAANNSSRSFKMVTNMQDMAISFQSAEAGAYAALGLVDSANDPYQRVDNATPFSGIAADAHPLRNLPNMNAVDVDVTVVALDRPCPRSQNAASGNSVDVFDCDYYQIDSAHNLQARSRTQVQLGVVKTIIGATGG
jgi:type IV pilus assembly protein PilX